jgi:DNA polymerase-1
MSGHYTRVVVCDFEYEITDGDLPNVLCMVAHVLDEHLRPLQVIRMWRGDFGIAPPFDIGEDSLFVAYSAQAELTCFLTLRWRFPVNVFDLYTAYLSSTNYLAPHDPEEQERKKRERKRLSDACRAYGIDGWERIEKDVIAKDIGEGRWQLHGKEHVLEYCEEDGRATAELLRRQLRGYGRFQPVQADLVLRWSEFSSKAVAQIQARGMPVDVPLWNLVQENREAVTQAWLRALDPSYGSDCPIYSPDGEWSYARFENWLARSGVVAWPRLQSGQLDTEGDAFRLMAHIPGVEDLYALRESLRLVTGTKKLPIGKDGRNRPNLFPFGTATGRNAHTRSLYNLHHDLRSFMVFPSDKIGLYLDWRTREVGIAAALSGDAGLRAAYESGDVYHKAAFDAGLTTDPDRKHWAKSNPDFRNRMKTQQLGINYGMGVTSLAKGLQRHPVVACDMIENRSVPTRDSGSGVSSKSSRRRSIAMSRRCLAGRCTSRTHPTSARSITSRCKRTAVKCCASRQ